MPSSPVFKCVDEKSVGLHTYVGRRMETQGHGKNPPTRLQCLNTKHRDLNNRCRENLKICIKLWQVLYTVRAQYFRKDNIWCSNSLVAIPRLCRFMFCTFAFMTLFSDHICLSCPCVENYSSPTFVNFECRCQRSS
jgi:hypothetical protein